MKKYFLFLILFFFLLKIEGQTYREAYDITDHASGQGNSYCINAGTPLLDGEADILHSYLIMYRATHDKQYLDKFIIHSKRVQERRDDNVKLIYDAMNSSVNGTATCPALSSHLVPDDPTNKSWSIEKSSGSCLSVWTPTTLYSGKIMFPMAEFVYLVKEEFAGDLQSLSLPGEASGVAQYQNQYGATYDISESFSTIDTYLDYAQWLETRLQGTFDFLETYYWEPSSGAFYCSGTSFGTYCAAAVGCTPTSGMDINQQCAMGKALVYLYLAAESGDSRKSVYLDHIREIAKGLWCILNNSTYGVVNYHSDFFQASDGFWIWKDKYSLGNFESVGHGIEDATFLELCYRYGITFPSSSTLLFSESTVKKMANTLANIIYRNPLNSVDTVDGVGSTDNSAAAYWGCLIPYNPYIYQELSDYESEAAFNSLYYGSSAGPVQTAYLALAQSKDYQWNTAWSSNYRFNPVVVRRGSSYGSNTYYMTSGDFDHDGYTDLVFVDDMSGYFYSMTPDNPGCYLHDPNTLTNCWLTASLNHGIGIWKGMAAGNFDNSDSQDELFALTNDTIYFLKQSGATFSEQSLEAALSWAGIATCNSNGAAGDTALAVTASGDVYQVHYTSGSGIQLIDLSENIGISPIVGITSGHFDPAYPELQFAVVDNSPGYITIFRYIQYSTGGYLEQIQQYTGAGSDNLWTGITSGDFDGDGQDEIVAHRDADGQVIVYKVKSGSLIPTYGEYFPIDQSNRAMCSGHFKINPNGNAALVMLRNYDGQISIFNMDGICPSVTVNGVTVDDAYTINNAYASLDNNYVVDYHAHNTLTSGDFTVEGSSGSQVEFVAGKEIILKEGFVAENGSDFHAYIDDVNLSCDPQYFRKAAPHATPHSSSAKPDPAVKKRFSDPENSLTAQPNPFTNATLITYSIAEPAPVQLLVYNVYGQQVGKLVDNPSSPSGTFHVTFDSGDLGPGVYFYSVISGGKKETKKLVKIDD